MTRKANVFARVEPELKEQAELILNKLGIPMSNAVGMFLKQIVLQRGIPFEMKLPTRSPLAYEMLSKEEFDYEIQNSHSEPSSFASDLSVKSSPRHPDPEPCRGRSLPLWKKHPLSTKTPNHPPDGGLGVVEANGCFFESRREIDGHEGKNLHCLRLEHERGTDEVPLLGCTAFGDGLARRMAADVQGEPYGSIRAGKGTRRADSPLAHFGCR